MSAKNTQYVVMPSTGLIASEADVKQVQLFEALQHTATSQSRMHQIASHAGAVPVKVLDSIGARKAKLIECSSDDLPALRASNPSVRILPVVYFRSAVARYGVVTAAPAGAKGATVRALARSATIAITVVSAATNAPVAKATVVAFTDFANRVGAQGTTNARGQVKLAFRGAVGRIERVYIYPTKSYWPGLQANVALKSGATLKLQAIDLAYVDCVRHFYPGNDLKYGHGVTVGVIDSGVDLHHAGLVVKGGQNTVPGEPPTSFGDNGTEGHGTHVAGIIAARGTPPTGVRGVAPGVTLRSYRVFAQGGDQASNYAIAKAIDAGISDHCDLLNMSLGGGDPDPLTAEALTAARNAGVVVLAATGNDSRQPVSFPAANGMCQAVSAMGRKGTVPRGTEPTGSVAAPYGTDKKNFIADFSNVGPQTDLTGPGVGVISTVPSGFGVMSGTSMATPAETGAAARLLATKADILGMARDQARAAAMIAAIAADARRLGFGAKFEGNGMIS